MFATFVFHLLMTASNPLRSPQWGLSPIWWGQPKTMRPAEHNLADLLFLNWTSQLLCHNMFSLIWFLVFTFTCFCVILVVIPNSCMTNNFVCLILFPENGFFEVAPPCECELPTLMGARQTKLSNCKHSALQTMLINIIQNISMWELSYPYAWRKN